MRLPNFKKKYLAGALAVGLVMGAAGVAAAYFLATGTGKGDVSVGTAKPFTITQNTPVTGKLYPGTHVTTTFNIRNTGTGVEHYSFTGTDIAVAMNGTGTVITAFQTTSRAVVPGCKAAWFTTQVTGSSAGTLGHGVSTTVGVRVTMTNVATTQDACQTSFPVLDVAFGGPAGFALFEGEGGSASWVSDSAAHLVIPANAPTYVTSKATGASAGIEVLDPPATLPATAPHFSTTAHVGGSPRWVIVFTNNADVFGYYTGMWSTGHGITVPYGSNWTTVKSAAAGLHVKQVFIVMTTTFGTGGAITITTVTYDGSHF